MAANKVLSSDSRSVRERGALRTHPAEAAESSEGNRSTLFAV